MHHPEQDQVAEYRRQAREIRSIVQRISIGEACEQLLETAEHLERLAEAEERKAYAHGSKLGPQTEGS